MTTQDTSPSGIPEWVLSQLRIGCGLEHVLTDPSVTRSYTTDHTGRPGTYATVVRPGNDDELCQVVELLTEAGIVMIPQGGNTGLVGGTMPSGPGCVLVSTLRLADISSPGPGLLLVGAGVTLADMQAYALAMGMEFPVDIGSRQSATAGGLIATNARGVFGYSRGAIGDHVLGLEVVTRGGIVASNLAGHLSDSAGYPWKEYFRGSEGTLGIITKVLFRLSPSRPMKTTAIVAASSVAAAVHVALILRDMPDVDAVEFMLASHMVAVSQELGLGLPIRFPAHESPPAAYLLVETAGVNYLSAEALINRLEAFRVEGLLLHGDGVGPEMWAYRHGFAEVSNRHNPLKLDVTVPLGHYDWFLQELDMIITTASARAVLFGHIAVGNLHVNVLDPADRGFLTQAVLNLVSRFGGSISSEHGVGRDKREYLGLTRSQAEIDLMRAVKHALDPEGLFNRGAVLLTSH